MQKKILVSVNGAGNSNWWQQLSDIASLGIKEFALFLSISEKTERMVILREIDKLNNITIPFIHARHDMELSEYLTYISKFKTAYFNLHSTKAFPGPKPDLSKIKGHLLLENTTECIFAAEEMKNYAGVCLDTAHYWSDYHSNPQRFKYFLDIFSKYPILANHLSGFSEQVIAVNNGTRCHDVHNLERLDQLDYIRQVSKDFLSSLLALELSNDIKTQLEAKEYIKKIIQKLTTNNTNN